MIKGLTKTFAVTGSVALGFMLTGTVLFADNFTVQSGAFGMNTAPQGSNAPSDPSATDLLKSKLQDTSYQYNQNNGAFSLHGTLPAPPSGSGGGGGGGGFFGGGTYNSVPPSGTFSQGTGPTGSFPGATAGLGDGASGFSFSSSDFYEDDLPPATAAHMPEPGSLLLLGTGLLGLGLWRQRKKSQS